MTDGWVLVGPESSGKSTLAATLTGHRAEAANVRGATVAIERYRGRGHTVLDTPGLSVAGDGAAVAQTLSLMEQDLPTLAVVRATALDEDLARTLPVVAGRNGAIVVTHRDRLPTADHEASATLQTVASQAGVPCALLDARTIGARETRRVDRLMAAPGTFSNTSPRTRTGWDVRQRRGVLSNPVALAVTALVLLVMPAVAAVFAATVLAGYADPALGGLIDPLVQDASALPHPFSDVVAGDYGLLTMLPFLFVWALPTVVVFALLLAVLKASGVLELVARGLHPLMRPLGLSGRDIAPFVMGFGCNVPAVINTRACSACSRRQAVSALAFGSACSYQLGSAAAVFAARGTSLLIVPYVLFLLATAALYARITRPPGARQALEPPGVDRTFVVRPRGAVVWREAMGTLGQFLTRALPIFIVICVAASALQAGGILPWIAAGLGPALSALGLPADAALPVVLAAVRKDGLLLLGDGGVAPTLDALHLFGAVYLGGVLTPCLVTLLTVGRELGARFAARMLTRQVAFAIACTASILWLGPLCGL